MKRYSKKLLSVWMILILTMAVAVMAEAKTITLPARTVTVYSNSSLLYNSFLGKYNSSNESILNVVPSGNKVTSLKSSQSSVVSLAVKNGNGNAKGMKGIFIKAKKAGTATVSYKSGSDTYKVKITVKKYTSPFSQVKLGKHDLLSKFKTKGVYYLDYSKYANKTLKLSYKAKKGWEISASYLYKSGNQKSPMVANNGSFKVEKRNSALILNAYNAKTTQNEQCLVIFK